MRIYALAVILAIAATSEARGRRVTCQNGQCAAAQAPIPEFRKAGISAVTPYAAADALDEVNAKRAARGLRPYVKDDGLTRAAQSCAAFRAQHHLFGHSQDDFKFLPAGTHASTAGCAAYPASYGWMSCAVYESHTYAGAAYVTGSDGKRYMHLFCR